MTAASNPAAELTESEIERWAYNDPDIDSPVLFSQKAVERILAARLAAGGAATDEELDDPTRFTPDVLERALAVPRRAPWQPPIDAAPAPTEDAAAENRRAFIETAQEIGMMLAPAVSRAADTAAEEPRTEAQCESILPGGSHACGGHRSEAQIKAEALREAADDWCVTEDPHESDLIDNGHIDQWLRDRADRLSRADEGAGS